MRGVDLHFINKTGTKRLVGIESVESHFNFLSGLSDELQEKLLISSTEDAAELQESIVKRLVAYWTSGDIEKLESLTRESSHMPEEVKKVMETDRNPHMADVAEQFLKGGEQAFLVVGVGHMTGKDGIVSILQKRGYKVEQVALKK